MDQSEPVIDWPRLIRRIVDEDIAREIVPLCVEDNRERIEMLAHAVKDGNAGEVRLYAHAMKGSTANISTVRLPQIAERLEQMAGRDDLSRADQLLREIKSEFARLESLVSNPDWIEVAKEQRPAERPE